MPLKVLYDLWKESITYISIQATDGMIFLSFRWRVCLRILKKNCFHIARLCHRSRAWVTALPLSQKHKGSFVPQQRLICPCLSVMIRERRSSARSQADVFHHRYRSEHVSTALPRSAVQYPTPRWTELSERLGVRSATRLLAPPSSDDVAVRVCYLC